MFPADSPTARPEFIILEINRGAQRAVDRHPVRNPDVRIPHAGRRLVWGLQRSDPGSIRQIKLRRAKRPKTPIRNARRARRRARAPNLPEVGDMVHTLPKLGSRKWGVIGIRKIPKETVGRLSPTSRIPTKTRHRRTLRNLPARCGFYRIGGLGYE